MESGGTRGRRRRRRMWEVPQAEEAEVNVEESERVPPSLHPIVPILRAASEIEQVNPRVAYLCRCTAYEKVKSMDPNSSGPGVRQFKTYLLHRLEKDEQETQRGPARTDAREVQSFYELYCRENLQEGIETRKPDEKARYYQIAYVLYDVLKTLTTDKYYREQHPHRRQHRRGEEGGGGGGMASGGWRRRRHKWEVPQAEEVEVHVEESERVPPSLQPIVPILRAASEVEPDNPRVAYLCRFTAYEKAHTMDPYSSGRGVRQFKTYLLHRLEKDEQETQRRLASTDAREIQKFYKQYCTKNLEEGLQTRKPDEMARYYQIASVLYDVLKTVMPEKSDPEFDKYAEGVEKEKASYSHYNILPLNISGPTQPVMEIPEIKAAVDLLRRIENLPKPRPDPNSMSEEINSPFVDDLLDWLGHTFGFQKGNVENQKEHLILLLANIDMRKGGNDHQGERHSHMIQNTTVMYLKEKIFENYISWCQYLHLESNIKIPNNASKLQLELLYIGLYLLIWGEASNVRFMPECLCYIFHHMAKDLYDIISDETKDYFHPHFWREGSDDAFLQLVIQPIYKVMQKEAARSKHGTVSHSKWRNYDDLNEYFWSKKCFKQLGWPMHPTADFFADPKNDAVSRRRMSKTNFVEVHTFLHLFRSFYRMWTFFILAFQAMVIIAWSPTRSLSAILEPDVFRNVLTIFITAAFLNFFKAMLEIILDQKAWRSLEWSLKIRRILKCFIATMWLIVLPTTYFVSLQNPTGLVKFFSKWIRSQSFYSFTIVLYIIPSILDASIFIFSPIQRAIEHSNSYIIRFFIWWTQPKLYVAQGMHEDTCSLLKYSSFWILLLMWKLAFSFYVEIAPLVGPTRTIMFQGTGTYARGVVIIIWAPIIMVYLMDTQIWYAIFSTICGGVTGALCHLGEIRNLGMVRSRFEELPGAFSKNLVPRYKLPRHHYDKQSKRNEEGNEIGHIDKFSDTWNLFIKSLREEDLISNRERSLLIVPSSSGDVTVFQWPAFLLASKIPDVLDMVRRVKRKDEELTANWLRKDPFAYYAVIECYETVLNILYRLIDEQSKRQAIHKICEKINHSIDHQTLAKDFRLAELPQLRAKFGRLLNLLVDLQKDDQKDIDLAERQIVNLLQDIMQIFMQNIMCDGNVILKDMKTYAVLFRKINLDALMEKTWMEKCVRLQSLLTTEDSAIHVPTNLEARRRIIFFANSLFMKMPRAPQVQHMMSFSLLTTYFQEDVLFKPVDLHKMNEDGMSMLYYLRTICPDEWQNFLERIADFIPIDEATPEICEWASYRGQTLTRTVRGMMYYRKAIEIQCMQDKLGLAKLEHDKTVAAYQEYNASLSRAHAIADIKFTFVVACQAYGMQKASKNNDRDRQCYLEILDLMITYPSLRVAYIDEIEGPTKSGTTEKTYYSVLVRGGEEYDEEIYRIKLPGKPMSIGEEKSENQNHAIIFTRGEGLQAINMNQDNYLEEAFKMRNVLEEFGSTKHGKCKSTILGLREHIFTGSVSSLSWFASNQETSFVTIGQRVLANLLKVRFHYGHSDVFDRLFHITRGGISKASRIINLSGDTLSGFNSIMRGGGVTHHEYMQVGKGRDAGMNQLSNLEARVANGNGEQTISRDIYRLGHRFDFYRMLSFYFTTVGFYFSTMVTVITLYIFLYGRLYLVMSGLEKSILLDPITQQKIKPLENVLALQSIFQLGFLLVLPMVMEVGLEKGFRTALGEFIIMQIQLAPLFFAFQLGTKSHYYGRTIMHGRSKYRPSGRDFFVNRVKFAENYRMYSRSHFANGLELLMLLVMYIAYGSSHDSSSVYLFVTISVWLLVASWLFAPFVFNPSCFEWHKTVNDWTDWRNWIEYRGGLDMSVDQSWEAWWISEQEHLRRTSIRALLFEIVLSLRFLTYQYVIVFHLNIANHTESFMVYALSWVIWLSVLVTLKMVSIGQQTFGTDLPLMFRILQVLVFFGIVSVTGILYAVFGLTIPDFLASILGFIPSCWCILLIGQACSPLLEKTALWDSFVQLGRAYDNIMGFILFVPIAVLSWFPYVAECHTRLLFNQTFTRGLKISSVLDGQKDTEDF